MSRTLEGHAFVFEPPAGWGERTEGNRLVFTGPAGEDLQVSGVVVSGSGSAEQSRAAASSALANALTAVREAAAHPALKELTPLRQTKSTVSTTCWEVASTADGGATLFAQAVVGGPHGVLLATIEGPARPATTAVFRALLESVRPRDFKA